MDSSQSVEDGFTLAEWQRYVQGNNASIAAFQRQLAPRVQAKFSQPSQWTWARRLLEQSSDEWVARMVASKYPEGELVHDVCCGAGADSVALGLRGPVRSLDAAPIASLLCESNLKSHRVSDFSVSTNVAEMLVVAPEDWIHIDPDRRSVGRPGSGTKTTQAELFMPTLDIVIRLIAESKGGSVKVAPVTVAQRDSFAESVYGSKLYEQMGKQFISWGSSVRQQRWWWNIDHFPAQTTTVSIMRAKDNWYHWRFELADSSISKCYERIVESIPSTACLIGDTDPAVRAANGQGVLASERDCYILNSEQGYLVADHWTDQRTFDAPFIQWFEIEEVFPLDRKKLKQYFRAHDIGVLEIKVRDVSLLPEVLRKELKLAGKETRTLLVCRSATKHIAIVAKRRHPIAWDASPRK